jgi:hypothetical protein
LTLGPVFLSAGVLPYGVCQYKVSGFQFCRHMIDPRNRLCFLLMDKNRWNHSQAMQALDAYADFLTLKVLEKDYDGTRLSPTDIIDEVSGRKARHPSRL